MMILGRQIEMGNNGEKIAATPRLLGYKPGQEDLMAAFAMLLYKEGGSMVVKRETLARMNRELSSNIRAEHFPAEDVIKITLTQKFPSGIILPSGITG